MFTLLCTEIMSCTCKYCINTQNIHSSLIPYNIMLDITYVHMCNDWLKHTVMELRNRTLSLASEGQRCASSVCVSCLTRSGSS